MRKKITIIFILNILILFTSEGAAQPQNRRGRLRRRAV